VVSHAGRWTAILLAGQRPGENGFARDHGVDVKALIPVAGRPMLRRVVDALLAVPSVENVVVLAQEPDTLVAAAIPPNPRVKTAVAGAGISTSIRTAAGSAAAPFLGLVVTADHPLLTPDMVQAFRSEERRGG